MSDLPKVEQIDLTALPLQNLQQLKLQIEAGLNILQDSFQTLYKCRDKYSMSREAISQIDHEWSDKPILVPLTSSMYVPGVVKQIGGFIVNIGTGYYAEKSLQESKNYFERKVNYVQEQIDRVNNLQMQKSESLNAVHEAIELKVAASTKNI